MPHAMFAKCRNRRLRRRLEKEKGKKGKKKKPESSTVSSKSDLGPPRLTTSTKIGAPNTDRMAEVYSFLENLRAAEQQVLALEKKPSNSLKTTVSCDKDLRSESDSSVVPKKPVHIFDDEEFLFGEDEPWPKLIDEGPPIPMIPNVNLLASRYCSSVAVQVHPDFKLQLELEKIRDTFELSDVCKLGAYNLSIDDIETERRKTYPKDGPPVLWFEFFALVKIIAWTQRKFGSWKKEVRELRISFSEL